MKPTNKTMNLPDARSAQNILPAANVDSVVQGLAARFGESVLALQGTRDRIPTIWIRPDAAHEILLYLKKETPKPYSTLYDLTAVDERTRSRREDQPAGLFTVVYHLLSYERDCDIRLKVPLSDEYPKLPTVTDIWPAANWYEREVWDMFGITFTDHPHLRRILMPPWWQGHPLRKDHPARATEMQPFQLPAEKQQYDQDAMRFVPEDWGMKRQGPTSDFLFLNFGPHHPSTHGVFRIILQLDSEEIIDAVPDIGFHHRAAEKMGERQSWHTYIPYTDRVDYLAGTQNNLVYCLSVEQLLGMDVPDRAKVIRVMLAELFRISNHLVYLGTFSQDVGALSPVFFTFTDREKIMEIIEAICGARLHPNWYRIGGVAQDLPQGWDQLVREFVNYMPARLDEYEKLVMENSIFINRTKGIGPLTIEQAIEWGVTGPNLRACGMKWDLRKQRPYSGYDWFDFEIATAQGGDCYARAVVHMEEMRQSLRIIRQCLENMPVGPYKSSHPATTPPIKKHTMKDIETLINHFLNVTWGPVIPSSEGIFTIEGPKGNYSYYLISDGNVISYRTRIRAASFPHLQIIPLISRGFMIPDLVAMLGSLDFVMSDVDR